MTKIIFVPFFAIFSGFLFTGCFEKPVEQVVDTHADGSKRTSIWVKSDGTIRKRNEWYSNGIKEFEVPYKDGEPHGEYNRWSVHGDLIGKGKFHKGKLDGPQETFFIGQLNNHPRQSISFYDRGSREGRWEEFAFNGNKIAETYYEKDKPTKVWKYWHKDTGTLIEETTCFENNENGYRKTFTDAGKPIEEYECRYGKKHGIAKEFYIGGSLRQSATLDNGTLNGRLQKFFANGKLLREEHYRNGVRDSVWFELNASGDTIFKQTFENGNGETKGFCEVENKFIMCSDSVFTNNLISSIKRTDFIKGLRYEETWENGEKTSQRAYYINIPQASPTACASIHHKEKDSRQLRSDSLASESFYKNGKLNGLYRNWHSNGQLQDSLNYIGGERFGEQISFDRDGRITKHTRENGKTGQVIFLMDQDRKGL